MMEDIKEKISLATDELFEENPREEVEVAETATAETESPSVPVDIYQQNADKAKETVNKSIPHGSSTLTSKIAEEALRGLVKAKRRAEEDSKYWEERGDKDRAEIAKQQYMEERFLPAVEMVIITSTPDEVLNNKSILSQFDEMTFEYGPGYTDSYIRTAYQDQLGNTTVQSDGYVRNMVERIKSLVGDDQIRSAYGLAKKLKKEIDEGAHTSSDDDYEIITRVATID